MNQDTPAQSASPRFDARRVYTVLVLAPLLYAAIRYLPPPAFAGLVLATGAIALLEFYRFCLSVPYDRPLIAAGLIGFASLIFAPHQPGLIVPGMLIMLAGALSVPLVLSLPLEHALRNIAMALFGALYLGIALSFLVSARLLPQGEWLIFFLLLVTWAADTGAYYAGTIWGRHRLAPRISPKKSVEGLAGGLIGAAAAAYAARWWFLPALSPFDAAVLAVLLTGVGLWGDLAESALKRSAGIKDSGGVLPGHGGMLDRLDSLLFSAPAFYYYVTLLGWPETMP